MRRRELIALLGGAAVVVPIAVRAQQPAIPVVGFLSNVSAGTYTPFVTAFRQGLGEAGYVEGRDVSIEYRWAEGHYDRLPGLAAELARRRVAVLVSSGGESTLSAVKATTETIPVVFIVAGDPVQEGFVRSLSRPGGNMTGVSLLIFELGPKRLELLMELMPRAAAIAMLVNPVVTFTAGYRKAMADAARARGVELHVLSAGAEGDFEAVFAAIQQERDDALVVGPSAYFTSRREQLAALAARHRVPAIFEQREFVEAGGLMSYGTDLRDAYRQAGVYAGRVLKGENPAELPVIQSTKVELVVNLKTAKALGLTVPQSLLARADEVIE